VALYFLLLVNLIIQKTISHAVVFQFQILYSCKIVSVPLLETIKKALFKSQRDTSKEHQGIR
jgi:hypothetical protein